MDPITLLALSSLGSGAGSVLGGLFSKAPDLEKIYGNLDLPSLDALVGAGHVGPTAYDGIQEDPATRAAQMRALASMQNVADQGGMDAQSRAAQLEAMEASNQNDRANRQAVLEQMAMRGMRGGGQELAAQLAGAQSSAQANAMAGSRAAADARSRALQAMMASGQMAGQVRGQDWSNASERAQARDRIAQFNANNGLAAQQIYGSQQLQRAAGQAGTSQAQYGRDVNMGGAGGQLAGGAFGYLAGRNRKPGEGW